MGKVPVASFLKKNMDWVRKTLDIEDALERGDWGDETVDDNGNKKETIAQYARKALT